MRSQASWNSAIAHPGYTFVPCTLYLPLLYFLLHWFFMPPLTLASLLLFILIFTTSAPHTYSPLFIRAFLFFSPVTTLRSPGHAQIIHIDAHSACRTDRADTAQCSICYTALGLGEYIPLPSLHQCLAPPAFNLYLSPVSRSIR